MNITLFMAISANGLIATEEGNEDFLSHENWKTFASLVKTFGNIVVGSKTYEAVTSWNEDYNFDDFQNAKRIIVSDNPNYELKDGYQLASSPEEAISILEKEGFEQGLLSGGSALNSSFATQNFIDEVILNVEPVLVGKGIPLFHPQDFQLQLELLESQQVSDGIIQLRYKVIK